MQHADDRAIFALERPDPRLWSYYLLSSLLAGPFFFIALLPLYFRYHTLRYRFDQEGISMGWGILFRREIHLTYSRIQDIHLVANFVERWLGLAKVQIQTASGSASAEMTLEGLLDADGVRDFLYSRMRGARDSRMGAIAGADGGVGARGSAGGGAAVPRADGDAGAGAPAAAGDPLATTLAEVAAELRALRLELGRDRERAP